MTMPARKIEPMHHRRKLRVVKHRRPRDRHISQHATSVKPSRISLQFVMMVALMAVAGYLIIATQMGYNNINVLNRELSSNAEALDSMRAENDYLKMQLAPYVADTRIEQMAKSRLGMSHPKKDQVIALGEGEKVAKAAERTTGIAPGQGAEYAVSAIVQGLVNR